MNEPNTPETIRVDEPTERLPLSDDPKDAQEAPTAQTPASDPPFRESSPAPSPSPEVPEDQPADPVAPKVWTAADAPKDSAPKGATGIRVAQLVWACVVVLTSVFLIALPFLETANLPLFFIALVALLGLSLIVAAFVVGREPKTRA